MKEYCRLRIKNNKNNNQKYEKPVRPPPLRAPCWALMNTSCTLGPAQQNHVTAHTQMLAILATSLATLELTPDTWEKEVTNSGKSAMVK